MQLEVLFTPAEIATLEGADLRHTACVVFDVLRATSSMVTALANGARTILPVASIEEALAEKRRHPECLLAGERDGLRIGPEMTQGILFDFGNSPREFIRDRVAGKTIIMTTTNGTRALHACTGAGWVAAGSFLNLSAISQELLASGRHHVLVVCSGTGEGAAYEDALGAGALCEALTPAAQLGDSALLARACWRHAQPDWNSEIRQAQNATRLLARVDLAPDIEFCLRLDSIPVVPRLQDGRHLSVVPRA